MKFVRNLKIRKLNSKGFGHQALVALLVITSIAGIGAYRVWSSSAATLNNSLEKRIVLEDGCVLAGRVWNEQKKDCEPKCRAGTGEYKSIKGSDGTSRGFCTESVAENMNTVAEAKRCTEQLHRFYIREVGCARRASQENANNAKQCVGYNSTDPKAFKNYVAEGGTDKCIAPKIAQTGNNTPAPSGNTGHTTPSDNIEKSSCLAMGRSYNDAKKVCNRDCRTDAGTLLVHANKSQYCSNAVATNITEARCAELHRKWTASGCSRRADQKDNARDTISCIAGHPYYNSNSEASASNKLDVCEKNKPESDKNEKAGLIGGRTPEPNTPSTPTNPSQPDSSDEPAPTDTSGFRIVLYSEKDFKGDSVVIREATPDLGKNWSNKVSSYKVTGGRWQLCPEKEYKANDKLNCIRPWSSDPNLNDINNKNRHLNNKITSIRPIVKEVFTETTADVIPSCNSTSGVPVDATADRTCPTDTVLTCPAPLELKNGECMEKTLDPQVVVPVDKSFKGKKGQEHCELLGREWIGKPSGKKVINGGEYGCSMFTCERERDGAPRQTENGPVCINYQFDAAYAVTMTKKKCDDLHRVYIDQVNRCAQVPNRKDKNQTIVNAKQCEGKKHSVYYIFKENAKNDECFSPGYFDRAKSVTKSVGGSLSSALKQGPRAYCNTVKRGNFHWDGKGCVIDRKKCWNGQSVPVNANCPPQPAPAAQGSTGTGTSDDGGGTTAYGGPNQDLCGQLGRVWSNGTCLKQCVGGGAPVVASPYDYCNIGGTGGGDVKDCRAGYYYNTAKKECMKYVCSSSICNPNQPVITNKYVNCSTFESFVDLTGGMYGCATLSGGKCYGTGIKLYNPVYTKYADSPNIVRYTTSSICHYSSTQIIADQ